MLRAALYLHVFINLIHDTDQYRTTFQQRKQLQVLEQVMSFELKWALIKLEVHELKLTMLQISKLN